MSWLPSRSASVLDSAPTPPSYLNATRPISTAFLASPAAPSLQLAFGPPSTIPASSTYSILLSVSSQSTPFLTKASGSMLETVKAPPSFFAAAPPPASLFSTAPPSSSLLSSSHSSSLTSTLSSTTFPAAPPSTMYTSYDVARSEQRNADSVGWKERYYRELTDRRQQAQSMHTQNESTTAARSDAAQAEAQAQAQAQAEAKTESKQAEQKEMVQRLEAMVARIEQEGGSITAGDDDWGALLAATRSLREDDDDDVNLCGGCYINTITAGCYFKRCKGCCEGEVQIAMVECPTHGHKYQARVYSRPANEQPVAVSSSSQLQGLAGFQPVQSSSQLRGLASFNQAAVSPVNSTSGLEGFFDAFNEQPASPLSVNSQNRLVLAQQSYQQPTINFGAARPQQQQQQQQQQQFYRPQAQQQQQQYRPQPQMQVQQPQVQMQQVRSASPVSDNAREREAKEKREEDALRQRLAALQAPASTASGPQPPAGRPLSADELLAQRRAAQIPLPANFPEAGLRAMIEQRKIRTFETLTDLVLKLSTDGVMNGTLRDVLQFIGYDSDLASFTERVLCANKVTVLTQPTKASTFVANNPTTYVTQGLDWIKTYKGWVGQPWNAAAFTYLGFPATLVQRSDCPRRTLDDTLEWMIDHRDDVIQPVAPVQVKCLGCFTNMAKKDCVHKRCAGCCTTQVQSTGLACVGHNIKPYAAAPAAVGGGGGMNYNLPPGWSVAFEGKRPYFINHVTRVTSWDDPRPLPMGWGMGKTPQGRIYYINNVNRSTQWVDPRPPIVPM